MSFYNLSGAGYVATDPKYFESQTGMKIVSFSLPIKNKDQTQWLKCTLFGKGAEYAEGKLLKGTFVAFSGTLKPFSYQNKQGQEITGIEVNISPSCLSFPLPPGEHTSAAPHQKAAAPYRSPAASAPNLDDIPF